MLKRFINCACSGKEIFFRNTLFFVLIFFCFVIFSVPCHAGSAMREKLSALDYNFSNVKDYFLIKGGQNNVLVTQKPERNIEKNTVYYTILTIWQPMFLSKDHINKLIEFNKKSELGKFTADVVGNRILVGYSITVPKDVTSSVLSNAIRETSRIKLPFAVNISEQDRLSIIEVLDKDRQAGLAGGGHEAVAQRMSKIDLSFCPEDFQNAYIRHIKAWGARLGATEAGVALGGDDPGAALVLGLYGALLDGAVQSEDIKSSFSTVLQIAEKYGVNTKPYR